MTRDDILRPEPGWDGKFTRENAPGAIQSGTRVVKVNSAYGDLSRDGSRGVILGSVFHPALADGEPMYFVEWEHTPKRAVACMGWKRFEAAHSPLRIVMD